ncbi:MAG: macro domain-containing protein [Xanthobacteraceae bacterium]
MIEFVQGDMFETPADIRVNTVNCVGVMGTGVALAFKQRYPEMFKAYRRDCCHGLVRPGKMHIWRSLRGDWVVNFPTKRHWKDDSLYEDIEHGLDDLRAYLVSLGEISVTLPALGCGHGGLEWGRVSKMIASKLEGVQAHVKVFEPLESRKVGHIVIDEISVEEIRSAQKLGFVRLADAKIELPGVTSEVFAKGNFSGLKQPWIAVLPSRDAGERELGALHAVAKELGRNQTQITVALLHASRASEEIAQLFVDCGIDIVILAPFGVLTRKSIARLASSGGRGSVTVLSTARPSANWSRALFAQAAAILRQRAWVAVLSDPTPDWLASRSGSAWQQRRMFYLRYDGQPESAKNILLNVHALPIGRRSETGTPNLDGLLRAYYDESINLPRGEAPRAE